MDSGPRSVDSICGGHRLTEKCLSTSTAEKNYSRTLRSDSEQVSRREGESFKMSKQFTKYGCICLCVSICILVIALFGFYIGAGRFLKVPSFQVLHFELSGLDESLSSFRVNTESTFTIETPNRGKKMHIYYNDFYVTVWWQHVNMGHGKVAGFDQGSKNTSKIHGSFRSQPANVQLDVSQRALLTDARNRGRLTLSIDLDVKTQWKDLSGLKSDKFDAKIECKVNINPQIATGSQLLYQQCEVLDFKCLAGC